MKSINKEYERTTSDQKSLPSHFAMTDMSNFPLSPTWTACPSFLHVKIRFRAVVARCCDEQRQLVIFQRKKLQQPHKHNDRPCRPLQSSRTPCSISRLLLVRKSELMLSIIHWCVTIGEFRWTTMPPWWPVSHRRSAGSTTTCLRHVRWCFFGRREFESD